MSRNRTWSPMRPGERSRARIAAQVRARDVTTTQPHCLPVPRRTGRLRVVVSVRKRGVETTVETAVMIQGQAHRKTMKSPRLNPLSLIQGKRREHRSSNGHQHCAPPRWKARRASGERNIGDPPMLETLQPHRLPVPWQRAICPFGCEL